MRARVVLAVVFVVACGAAAGAGPQPCRPTKDRVRTLRTILDADWLTIRPEHVKASWYRNLESAPSACYSAFGCLFLGNATVLPGSGQEPSIGDCSEGFIFNPAVERGPALLTSVSLDEEFGTVAEAQRAAELLADAIRPPEGACPFLHLPWGVPERGRECDWAADGDWLLVLSVRIVHRGHTWRAGVSVSREQF